MARCGHGLECKLRRVQFRLNTLADNNIKLAFMKIKLTKNASTFHSPKKN